MSGYVPVEEKDPNFLYRWPHIKIAGATRVMKVNTAKFNHITVRERLAIRQTAKTESPRVVISHKPMVDV
jgi:hypothetical protein